MRSFVLGIVLVAFALSSSAATPQYLDQNWNESDRLWFYSTAQGSKLIPFAWAKALERADSEQLFLSSLTQFGYLPNPKSPDGLPVGFVRDTGDGAPHLGMTCAACHTNQVDYRGTSYQIDGAPTDADLFNFLASLGEALAVTTESASSPKFLRFAQRVGANTPAKRAALYTEVRGFSRNFSDFVAATRPKHSWGPARADAFGAIFNRVTAIDLKIPSNNQPPDAPVSYPFLWDTSWHNVVQWNGSAPNRFAVMRLARNVGEVLGVFARIDIRKPKLLHWYYRSTAKRLNLLEMEDRLAKLRSPKWPAAFPAIDQARATAGQALYNKHCLSCHAIATPGQHQDVTMTPLTAVKTDPAMATIAHNRTNATGVLEGVPELVVLGRKLGSVETAGTITFNAVVGAILAPPSFNEAVQLLTRTKNASTSTRTGEGSEHELRQALLSKAHDAAPDTVSTDDDAHADITSPQWLRSPVLQKLKAALAAHEEDKKKAPQGLAYKARPLDGIWATAPYLHNGSVPTLRALLLPEAERPATFYVGSREFDPVNVGFDASQAPGRFRFDTALEGNTNTGHIYGTKLTAEERDALLEYLKSL
jgi:cytochrome c peroxidase